MRTGSQLLLATVALGTVLSAAPAYPGDMGDGVFDFSNKNKWLFRLRAIDVVPDESSSTSIGGKVTADNSVVPEFDITYFWTKNIASELILATSKHDMGVVNTAIGDVNLGDVWVLPPTLTVQYHFMPEQTFRPYVGAGLNYTFFYNADPVDVPRVTYKNGWGYALQTGFDYGIDEHWAFNADVKKIFFNTDANVANGTATADVDLDPWVFGVGIAYRF